MILDLFGGPGGWDEGLTAIGNFDLIGIDSAADACETARAAGHPRLLADVAALNPNSFGQAYGIVASPPCQSFSRAGMQTGARDLDMLIDGALELFAGRDPRRSLRGQMADPRSLLVLEPLRWVLAQRPMFTAWEQVPAAMPLWSYCAELLNSVGYSTWAGLISTETFGLPQTRRRAILLASDKHDVTAPVPSHSQYVIRQPRVMQLDVLPWVSMSEALGWPESAVIGFPRIDDGRGAAVKLNGIAYRARDFRAAARPANTVTEKIRSWQRWDTPDSAPVRVSIDEAAILQGFREGYPWSGLPTQVFRQLANAVPPPIASALLGPLLREAMVHR